MNNCDISQQDLASKVEGDQLFMENLLIIVNRNALFLVIEFLFGVVGAWFISRFAPSIGLIDAPSVRSSHNAPTPKGGGIGILCAFIIGCFVFKINFLFSLPATFISLLSLFGDRYHIHPKTRLIFQFAAVFIIVYNLPPASIFHHSNILLFNYILLILAALFCVGTANFYNFMDGINGIAGITGGIGFSLLTAYGITNGKDLSYVMLCAGIAMACLGFLPFNVPKARVFMGDVGSILLGLVFAVIVVIFSQTLVEFLVLSSFFVPLYADELLTIFERLHDRHSLFTPHRRHLYQVLANEAGMAHWKVSLVYGTAQFLIGLCLWFIADIGLLAVLTALFLVSYIFLMINFLVKRHFSPLVMYKIGSK